MDSKKPSNNISSGKTDGIADGKADLSPDEIKKFYHAMEALFNQASDIFARTAHHWPKHRIDESSSEQNDYQWVQHRYRNALNNAQDFMKNPNRATYKEYLLPLRERLADKSDLENMHKQARKHLNPQQIEKDGWKNYDPHLLKKAMTWIDSVDKLTTEFVAKVDALYPPGQQQSVA